MSNALQVVTLEPQAGGDGGEKGRERVVIDASERLMI